MLASPLLPRPLALLLICAVTACSTKRQAPAHPPLALHHRPTREIQSLFLDDKEFRASQVANPAALKKLPRRIGNGLAGVVLFAGMTSVIMFLVAGGGGEMIPGLITPVLSKDDSWPDDLDASQPAGSRQMQVTFHGENVVNARLPARSQGIFVQARGRARVKIVDAHGSYYARADEIQFRPDLQAVLLRGRVSLSAVNAPDLKNFGLLCIDLARCQAFYTGAGS
jgi:hypothetical protein